MTLVGSLAHLAFPLLVRLSPVRPTPPIAPGAHASRHHLFLALPIRILVLPLPRHPARSAHHPPPHLLHLDCLHHRGTSRASPHLALRTTSRAQPTQSSQPALSRNSHLFTLPPHSRPSSFSSLTLTLLQALFILSMAALIARRWNTMEAITLVQYAALKLQVAAIESKMEDRNWWQR